MPSSRDFNFSPDQKIENLSRESRRSSRTQELLNDQEYIQREIKSYKELNRELSKIEKARLKDLLKEEETIRQKLIKEEYDYRSELDEKYLEDSHKIAMENAEKQGAYIKAASEAFKSNVDNTIEKVKDGSLFSSISGSLSKTIDPIIDRYLSRQTEISAHLSGSSSSLYQITDNLQKAFSTSSLVRQEAVYNKLADLVSSGIVYNVEQRAFLETLANDMKFTFSSAGPLARLIRLQQQDSTANRLALEYNLQKFLNDSYKNSEYIKNAFETVSNSLIEMRALNSTTGQGVENTLQTWLGAMYSNGLSDQTTTSLASAFNALGSGDISNLGQGISNLVLMGVARAGLDYGDILNSGLNANQTNQIMSGISTYLQEMGANSSNVVKSQLAGIFGVNVADIIAATNTGRVNTTINDNIGTLFNDYGSFVSAPAKMMNLFDNMIYTWGTNVASSPLALGSYKALELLAPTLSSLVGGTSTLAGNLVAASPSIPLLLSLIPTMGDVLSSMGSLSGASNQLSGIFSALGGRSNATTVKVSGGGVSGSAYIGNGDMSGMFSDTKSSALDITDSFNIEGIKPEWEDNVSLITENTSLMLELMQDTMTSIRDDVNYVRNDFAYVNATIQALAGNFSGAAATLGSTLL